MTATIMRNVYDDGGRRAAGYTTKVGDCTTRAIAIATKTPYREVLKLQVAATLHTGDPSADANVNCEAVLVGLGWEYVKVARKQPVRSGVRTRGGVTEITASRRWPKTSEAIPRRGRYIASMHGHYAAVINGVVRDVWDSTRKPVYGYWRIKTTLDSPETP